MNQGAAVAKAFGLGGGGSAIGIAIWLVFSQVNGLIDDVREDVKAEAKALREELGSPLKDVSESSAELVTEVKALQQELKHFRELQQAHNDQARKERDKNTDRLDRLERIERRRR